MGAMASFLPNAVFSLFAFRFSGARQAQQVARSFSQGAKVKLAMTMSLFAIAFIVVKVAPLPLFASYLAVASVYYIALISSKSV